jgi:3',5'-cyclic AMP phosphodiesterase CpdA
VASCLGHIEALSDKPEFILAGGDCVMDCFEADGARTKVQWDLWQSVFKDNTRIPVEGCIGNHDIWGVNKAKSRTTGDEPLYGRKMAQEMLRMSNRFRSFDRAGWHFVVLDSVRPEGDGYKAYLDDEQFEWLAGDLAAVKKGTPTLVVSHIPILAACILSQNNRVKEGDFKFSGGLMHMDVRKVTELFASRPTVKVCLSGHIHMLDRVDFNGVSYLCNGAVSGSWWKGKHENCDEGYGVIDLYSDGSFKNEYKTYGWKVRQEPEDKG